MALTLKQARSVYNRIGRVQDWQAFYEDATTERAPELIDHQCAARQHESHRVDLHPRPTGGGIT